MPSSTSHHGSFDRGLLVLLFVGIVGAPLVWLTSIQAGYVLAYQACDQRSTAWVVVPTIASLGIVIGIAAACASAHRRAREQRLPMPLLGWMGAAIASLMIIVMIASSIAPIMLHSCD